MTNNHSIPDQDLIDRCIQGHRPSMERFYKMCLPQLWSVAGRYSRDELETRDILNSAMLKAFQSLATYKGPYIMPWLKTIVVNTGIDKIRQRNRHAQVGELTQVQENTVASESIYPDSLGEQEIMLAMRKLPEFQRTVLTLFAIEGFTHAEISEKLGITVINSRWHLHQARLSMKILLSKFEPAS
jgi:RNA polymerase sigma factor (sigma-70 family)